MKNLGTFNLGCGAIATLKYCREGMFKVEIKQAPENEYFLRTGFASIPGLGGSRMWYDKVSLYFSRMAIPELLNVLHIARNFDTTP